MCSGGNFARKLAQSLREIIHDSSFQERHRRSTRDFSRQGKLLFPTVLVLLLDLRHGSLFDELRKFFKSFHKLDVAEDFVSAAAFCKARLKIHYQAFVEINQKILNFFHRHGEPSLWNDYRLVAIDGSTVRLPGTKAIIKEFGSVYSKGSTPRCLGRTSLAYDPLNEIVLDGQLEPYTTHEHTLALYHLKKLKDLLPNEKTLFILDRGYVSFPLWVALSDAGGQICVCLKSNLHLVKKLNRSGQSEIITEFHSSLTAAQKEKFAEYDVASRSLKIRVIKRIRPGSNPLYLMTTLLDAKAFPAREIETLYRLRWKVEEDYKVKKCRLQIENWSGKSVDAVYQDFWSTVVYHNLMTMLRRPVISDLEEANRNREHVYKFNDKACLGVMKNTICHFLLKENRDHIIRNLQNLWLRCLSAVRPGREFIRKNKGRSGMKAQGFFMTYKSM